MAQLIIYTNETGNLSITIPTGEISIDEVLAKDCPSHAVIIDDFDLPKGADTQFLDAWILNGKSVLVDFAKAQLIYLTQYNTNALQIAQARQLNTLAGISNIVDDATWLAKLSTDRNAITSATNTDGLIAISLPT